MSVAVMIGLLTLFPAATLWGAYPRRRSASSAAAGLCAAYWLIGFAPLRAEDFPYWAVAGIFCMGACFYAMFTVGHNSREYERLEAALGRRQKERADLKAQVDAAKLRIQKIETEQREVTAIYGMIKGLSEALSWEDMRPKLEIAIRQYLGVEDFSLYVQEGGGMLSIARRGLASSVGAAWDTLNRHLQEHGVPVRVPHLFDSSEKAVGVPIFENEKLAGYFYVRVPEGGNSTVLSAKAENFVEEISFAFRRVRLFQDVERHSVTDGLTGLYRRGELDRKLKEEVVRGRTFKTTFCVMLLDIDHFKPLNDTYGHPFGNDVLARIGQILRDSFYETDFVARYGGEEFAVLLPRAQMEGVLRKAEAVRRTIEAKPFELAMQKIRITVSIGVAHFPRDGETAESVLRQADQALYYAKENGRNRTIDIAQLRGGS